MSTRQRFYRPELDILRFLAFMAVFVLHSSIFPSGWLAQARVSGAFGLCLFFFLSAFLIAELLGRERETTGTVRLGAFYMRRILRIWPLYFAALLLDFIHARIYAPGDFNGRRLVAYLLMLGNWYIAQHGFPASLTAPLWSISIEEQFYLLWPSVQRLCRRKVAVGIATATLVLSFLVMIRECQRGSDADTTLWVNSFVQFQFFATGVLVAMLLRHRTPTMKISQRLLLFVSGLSATICAQTVFHAKTGSPQAEISLVLPGYLLVNYGCIAIFFSFLGAQRLARARALIYLGKISYGLYVFHYPMLIFCSKVIPALAGDTSRSTFFALRAALALLCTGILAHLSYTYFEAPILRYKQRFEVIKTRTVEP